MPRIEPLAADEIEDPELRTMLAEAEAWLGDSLYLRILARKPHGAKRMQRALCAAGLEGSVDPCLKEMIRIQLASLAGDSYFSNLRSAVAIAAGLTEERIDAAGRFERENGFTDAERSALKYAKQMYTDRALNGAEMYVELQRYFSVPQVMELGSWIALTWGLAKWMRSMNAYPEHNRTGAAVSQEESARVYGVPPIPAWISQH